MGTKYDDWGWHIAGNFPPDQPEQNGLVHIAAYFSWIARRGWLRPELADAPDLPAALNREPGAAVRVMEWMDGKIGDEEMTDEAARFSDYYYADGFLNDWFAEFSDFPAYGVTDIPRTHDRIDPILDRRYAEWIAAGRPEHWQQLRGRRTSMLIRTIVIFGIWFGSIVLVALAGAAFNLRGFPWPLIQLTVVFGVLILLFLWDSRSGG